MLKRNRQNAFFFSRSVSNPFARIAPRTHTQKEDDEGSDPDDLRDAAELGRSRGRPRALVPPRSHWGCRFRGADVSDLRCGGCFLVTAPPGATGDRAWVVGRPCPGPPSLGHQPQGPALSSSPQCARCPSLLHHHLNLYHMNKGKGGLGPNPAKDVSFSKQMQKCCFLLD